MEEIWKDIEGYEGIYRVSSYGRVLSVNYGPKGKFGLNTPMSKVLRPSVATTGYLTVELYKGKSRKRVYVHRLVASAFIPNPVGKPEINHVDGNKQNNNVTNLEWVTTSENTRHAINNNLRFVNPAIGKYGKDNPNSKPVAQCDMDGNVIRIWDSREEAAKHFNTKRGSICNCANGRKKSLRGYTWKNLDEI